MKDVSIKIKQLGRKEDKSVEVSIEGDFSINHIEKLKDKLLEVLDKYNEVEIHMQNLETLDLAAIQLLHSLKISAGNEKKVRFHVTLSDSLKLLIERAGFSGMFIN
jgi:anti-anti-sigma regulatory factor